MSSRLPILPRDLPQGASITFESSSFFARNPQILALPSPDDVFWQMESKDWDSAGHGVVLFESLGLAVKYGVAPEVTIAEGQSLWALHRFLPQVPVPEIYGWTQSYGFTFLYMELIPGTTLEERWGSLAQSEKITICGQLKDMMSSLRSLCQEPGNQFIGDINNGPLGDGIFTNGVPPQRNCGPFVSVSEFHDGLSRQLKKPAKGKFPGLALDDIPDPYRQMLPDDSPIVFAHADLNPVNIMVSADSPCRVVAIINWKQSGWYPEYWEFAKAEYTALHGSEWHAKYLPLFLDEHGYIGGFDSYIQSFGC